MLGFCMGYVIIATFFVIIFSNYFDDFVTKNYEFTMISWMLVASISKYVMRKSAQIIDTLNASSNNHSSFVCFELLAEFIGIFIYSSYYRFFFFLPKVSQFLIFKSIHFLTEIFESGYKSSEWYFNVSQKYGTPNKDNVLVKMWLNCDNSDLMQWQVRCFIQCNFRFVASFLAGIYVLCEYNFW